MQENINVDFKKSNIRIEESKRGRMKVTFKMSKEEGESFKNFMEMIKPPEVPEETFYKHVFFAGCRALNEELKQLFEEQKAKLEAQKKLAENAENILEPTTVEAKVEESSNVIQGSFGKKVE